MKSEKNVIYERDIIITLTNIYINDLVDKLENNIEVDDFQDKLYNIQNLINTAKTLDWIANTNDECHMDEYYNSEYEQEINKLFNLDKLNNLLENF